MQTVGMGELVAAAAQGDQRAWAALVERYVPLVYSIIRRYRLSDKDAEDVSQTVWLRLVEHLGAIREPQALPGWLATTTRHEALGVLRSKRRTDPVDRVPAGSSNSGSNRPRWTEICCGPRRPARSATDSPNSHRNTENCCCCW